MQLLATRGIVRKVASPNPFFREREAERRGAAHRSHVVASTILPGLKTDVFVAQPPSAQASAQSRADNRGNLPP